MLFQNRRRHVEMSPSVQRAVKEHQKLTDEGMRRINNYQLTKFDRLQFIEILKDESKIEEVSKDLVQKILGPEYKSMMIKVLYGNTKELSRVTIQQYALYAEATNISFIEMYFKLMDKVKELIHGVLEQE